MAKNKLPSKTHCIYIWVCGKVGSRPDTYCRQSNHAAYITIGCNCVFDVESVSRPSTFSINTRRCSTKKELHYNILLKVPYLLAQRRSEKYFPGFNWIRWIIAGGIPKPDESDDCENKEEDVGLERAAEQTSDVRNKKADAHRPKCDERAGKRPTIPEFNSAHPRLRQNTTGRTRWFSPY